MKTFKCSCDSTIFFENNQCLSCGSELGWCPACSQLRAIVPDGPDLYRCGDPACNSLLVKCHNYAVEEVCNRCCPAPDQPNGIPVLCDYCRFNDTIPDLSVEGNRTKWRRLEIAKRRLLYTLDLLRMPYGCRADGAEPALSFDFKGDVIHKRNWWWKMGKEERVYTGHADGKITINIREADTVEREKARVSFQEAHRTVIGHFRHEIGHYYWDILVKGRCEEEFKAVFGDHECPSYSEALENYYQSGPTEGWQTSYVSAYATMHPWEDFAESFATYLDMVSVLDTAGNMGIADSLDIATTGLPDMVDRYVRLGVVLNEMNRAMGLLDLVPEIFTPAIVAKLGFVHQLVLRENSLTG